MYLAHRPVITVNKICKTYDILRSECTGAIGDPKPARTSPYDGTEPVILLRPEDMHARVNHKILHFVSRTYTITLSFVFLVRNTIIVIFQYLQQSYKMIKIKRTEVHRRQ